MAHKNGLKIKIKERTINYVDLFCGIGGFRQGIHDYMKYNRHIKFNCVKSVDIKQSAIDTYNLNFNNENENENENDIIHTSNVNDFDKEIVPEFQLLCAGFPCTPFSSAGNRKGFSDLRGMLVYNVIKICEKYRPETILLENVPNLLNINDVFETIISEFESLGYHMTHSILNTRDFHIPQDRQRLFIIGSLKKSIPMSYFQYAWNGNENVTLNSIIDVNDKRSDIPENYYKLLIDLHHTNSIEGKTIQDKRGGQNNIHSWDLQINGHISDDECQLMSQIMLERRKKKWAQLKQIKWMDGMPLTFNEIKTFSSLSDKRLQECLDHLMALNYLTLEYPKDLVDGKRQHVINNKCERGYNICKGKLSFPISKILNKNSYCPTLTATDSCKLVVIIDDTYIRHLNGIELNRLSGFPDNFIIANPKESYDLYGNSVCPAIVQSLMKLIYG